ncbi:MAG: HD domain-containing protein [bacterium]
MKDKNLSKYTKKELVNMLQEVKQQKKRVRSLMDDSPIGMYRTTLEGDVIYANKALASILGYSSSEELMNVNIYDKGLPSDKERQRFMKEIDKTGSVKAFESVWVNSEGKKVYIKEYARKVLDEDGNMIYYEGTIEDITEQKHFESMLRKSYEKVKTTLEEFLETLSKAIHIRDPYTAGHQTRVAELSVLMANELNWNEDRISTLKTAALLHDIGKIYIPAEILSRPGSLKTQEMDLVRTHPEIGYGILKNISFDSPVAKIVLQHHEYLDGTGYPEGLTEKEILDESKILTVADIAEALMSHRPYRPAFKLKNVNKMLSSMRAEKLDSTAVDICLDIINSGKFNFVL